MADETTPATPPSAPASAPAATTPSVDPVEFERLKTQLAELSAHKVKMDRDAEKLRAEKAKVSEQMDALRKLALGDQAGTAEDPKEILAKREAETRAAREADIALELQLSRGLLSKSLIPKDGDLDYVLFKIRKDPTLKEQATAGISDEFLESLKARGYVSTLSAAPPAPAPKPDVKAAAPPAGAAPADPVLANLRDFRQFVALPLSKQNELREKHPEAIATLRSIHERKLGTAIR